MRSGFLPQPALPAEPAHEPERSAFRLGFISGKNSGMWSGAFVGFLLGSIFSAGVVALRAWAATL